MGVILNSIYICNYLQLERIYFVLLLHLAVLVWRIYSNFITWILQEKFATWTPTLLFNLQIDTLWYMLYSFFFLIEFSCMPNLLTIWHTYGWQNNYWIYSANLGLQGFPAKDLHYIFLPQFTLVFYIWIREYSKVRLLYWMFSRYWSFYTIIHIELILEFKNNRGTKMKGNIGCFTDPAIFFPFFTLSNYVLLVI